MSLSDFLSPITPNSFNPETGFSATQLGFKTHFYVQHFPDLEEGKFDLAIVGVCEERGSINNKGCTHGADAFRKQFYQLHEGTHPCKLADLGNITAGKTLMDTYVAVKNIVAELIKLNIVPIIIGGGQDLTYAQYLAYENLEQKVDLVVVDAKLDLDDNINEEEETNSNAYLNKIILHQPNYLFNFSNIGYQTYFVSQENLSTMNKLFFDAHRLGDCTANMELTEPIVRNASMLSFDIGAIRSSDACANANASPNGFYGEEACRIARYAGMSDKLSSIGFYEFNPNYDKNNQTAMLLAQMVWYFIDGFYNRKKDFPLSPKSQYLIYRTNLEGKNTEITFVKSKKSDRWWMQVPYPSTPNSKNERFHLVPCHYNDYQIAINGEMPDLWWRTSQKLSLV